MTEHDEYLHVDLEEAGGAARFEVKRINTRLNKMPRNDMTATVTVDIELTRLFQLRYWTAVQLLRVIGWLLNSNIRVIREEVGSE